MKVYYLVECGTGRNVKYTRIDLVKEQDNNLTFKVNEWDFDYHRERAITLKAKRRYDWETKRNVIDFHSSKEQYKFCYIVEKEMEEADIKDIFFINK